MEMYFQELQKFTEDEMNGLMEMEKLKEAGDAKGIAEKQKDMKNKRTAFKVKADRLLKEVFEAGDTSDDGFLSKEESSKVFATLVNEESEYMTLMAKEEQRMILADELGMSKKFFDSVELENEDAIRKKLEDESKAEAKRGSEEIDKAMKAKLADYKAQKLGRDKAAFAVLDTSSDGRINVKEFKAAFDTTSETHEKFMAALGLN